MVGQNNNSVPILVEQNNNSLSIMVPDPLWYKGFVYNSVLQYATKAFAIRKMKTQFTNKNTHILCTDILQKHTVP